MYNGCDYPYKSCLCTFWPCYPYFILQIIQLILYLYMEWLTTFTRRTHIFKIESYLFSMRCIRFSTVVPKTPAFQNLSSFGVKAVWCVPTLSVSSFLKMVSQVALKFQKKCISSFWKMLNSDGFLALICRCRPNRINLILLGELHFLIFWPIVQFICIIHMLYILATWCFLMKIIVVCPPCLEVVSSPAVVTSVFGSNTSSSNT